MKHLPTIILRHRRENLKKCSLRGLEKREDFLFFTYPKHALPDLSSYVLLKVGAPPLTLEDQDKGIFLLDGTWKLASQMEKQIPKNIEVRSLPGNIQTAYPRRQTGCSDPEAGLASIEALYLALSILGRSTEGLLENYHFKLPFLEKLPLHLREVPELS